MKVVIERRARKNEIEKLLNEERVDITAESTALQSTTDRNVTLQQIRSLFFLLPTLKF
jgi:hypothetical protein